MSRHLTDTGDTIVEVLIAIAVVAAVFASSFVLVNRTTKNTRQTQEHSEALKLVESQIEQLKILAQDGSSPIYTRLASEPFCLYVDVPNSKVKIVNSTDPKCTVGSVSYALSIVRNEPANPNTFTAMAVWDSVIAGKDKVSIDYKLYP